MVDVQRGNVFLTIDEEDIEKYMAKGFSVVDAQGRVIRQSIPTSLSELQKAYSEHVNIIKEKDAEIAALKSALLKMEQAAENKTAASAPKSKLFSGDEESEEAEEQPKKQRKSKKE